MSSLAQIELPVFCDETTMALSIIRVLANVASPFQEIMVVESVEHGKCLLLDGALQFAESDHKMYDQEMLKPLNQQDKTVLILGGGDGNVAEMAIGINPDLAVTLVDLDSGVVDLCKTYFSRNVFDNPQLKLQIQDALDYLKTASVNGNGKFDGIVCDLTDVPVGSKSISEFNIFFEDLIPLSYKLLRLNGWISIQAGPAKVASKTVNTSKIIEDLLLNHFGSTSRAEIFIPSYGEEWTFLFSRK
jgi:spermidine synthase